MKWQEYIKTWFHDICEIRIEILFFALRIDDQGKQLCLIIPKYCFVISNSTWLWNSYEDCFFWRTSRKKKWFFGIIHAAGKRGLGIAELKGDKAE